MKVIRIAPTANSCRKMRLWLRCCLPMLAATLFFANAASAQTAQQSAIRIQVVDSAGRPIANADVSILHGLSTVVARGLTDTTGTRTLVVPSAGEYQVVARRLGFLRGSQFFSATVGTVAVRIQLASSPAALPTITVTAEADLRRQSYHVGADDIAASERPLLDGLDVLERLRPDMINARTPSGLDNCHIQNIWVNGQHIVYVATDARIAMVRRTRAQAQSVAHGSVGGSSPTAAMYSGITTVPIDILSVLGSIRPEHIDEINYTDCNDWTVNRAGGRSAVFIMLKPGVKFLPGVGSFVDDASLAIVGNRPRLIGVFAERSGEPLRGVEIVDAESGMFMTTSETGTTTLAFLPDGAHALAIRKQGYAEQRLSVRMAPEDTIPITIALTAAPKR
jgi:hypothetical protein